MRLEPCEVGRVHIHHEGSRREQMAFVAARSGLHDRDQFAGDLRRFEIAGKRLGKRAFHKSGARLLQPIEPTHRRRSRRAM